MRRAGLDFGRARPPRLRVCHPYVLARCAAGRKAPMRKVIVLPTLIAAALLLCGIDHQVLMGPGERSSPSIFKIKFECHHVNGKIVCGKKKTGQPKDDSESAPVEQPCPSGMIGKQPNCECPNGTYFAAYVGCVPVIPTAPPPKPGGSATHYCVTCGGPGCLQKAPACPSGGLTTCTDVPGKTYYNCCCN